MEWSECRFSGTQHVYPHTCDAFELHCLAKLNVIQKKDNPPKHWNNIEQIYTIYPEAEELKKPLTEVEAKELEIIKAAAAKREKYEIGFASPFHRPYRSDDWTEQSELIRLAKGGEPKTEIAIPRSSKEWREAWRAAIHDKDYSLGQKLGLFHGMDDDQ